MSEVIQFSYTYSRFKSHRGKTVMIGDGIYRMNEDSNVTNYGTDIIASIRQNFPTADDENISFGYMKEDNRRFIFCAMNRDDEFVITGRGGTDPYYIAHVTISDVLGKDCYPIEFFDSSLDNMYISEIYDPLPDQMEGYEGPGYYERMTEEQMLACRNPDFSPEAVRGRAAMDIPNLAIISSALLECIKNGKKLYLVGDPDDDVAEWIARITTILPRSIAASIGFCTYRPDASADNSGFTIIGAIDGVSKMNGIPDDAPVFYLGDVIKTQYFPSGNDVFYRLVSSMNEADFAGYCAFLDDWFGSRDADMDEFLFALSVYRVKMDPHWDEGEKMRFLTTNFTSPYNRDQKLQQFFLNDVFYSDSFSARLERDPDFAFATMQGLRDLFNSSNWSRNSAEAMLDNIFYYTISCSTTSHYVFDKMIDENYSIDSFFGVSSVQVKSHFLSKANAILDSLMKGIVAYRGVISNKILIALMKMFMPRAFVAGGVEMQIVKYCASALRSQGGMDDMIRFITDANSDNFMAAVSFLIELRDPSDQWYLIVNEQYYREKVLGMITDENMYDSLLRRYADGAHTNGELVGAMIDYKWGRADCSLSDIIALFEMRSSFSLVLPAFETAFVNIFNRNIANINANESSLMDMMGFAELNIYRRKIEGFICDLQNYSGNPEINNCATKIGGLLNISTQNMDNARRVEASKHMRISYILRVIRQLPPRTLNKLLLDYGIEVDSEDMGTPEYMNRCSNAVERFLRSRSGSIVDESKCRFCNSLDALVAKHRSFSHTMKSIADVMQNMLTGLILMAAFCLVTALVGWSLFTFVGGGYFAMIYYVFPPISALLCGVLYYYNGNQLRQNKRIILTVFETLLLVLIMLGGYHAVVLFL